VTGTVPSRISIARIKPWSYHLQVMGFVYLVSGVFWGGDGIGFFRVFFGQDQTRT
jgi:hypothetical protein